MNAAHDLDAPTARRKRCRSARLRTRGVAVGVRVRASKKIECRWSPRSRHRKANPAKRSSGRNTSVPAGLVAASPVANFVNTRPRSGPRVFSSEGSSAGRSMHRWIRPMNGIPPVGAVLPIGVLQQLAYQRQIPRGESRMHASRSVPAVSAMCAGDIWKISVPPCGSRTSAARPRKCANAWQSSQ